MIPPGPGSTEADLIRRKTRPLQTGKEYVIFFKGRKVVGQLMDYDENEGVLKIDTTITFLGYPSSLFASITKREWIFELDEVLQLLN